MKINFSKYIKIKKSDVKDIALKTIQIIQDDAEKGQFQTPDGKPSKPQLHPQYAKYKSNRMERFTDRLDKNGKLRRKGTKLKAHEGVSVVSTQIKYSNMILTNKMFRGMRSKHFDDGFKIGFRPEDVNKIIGNAKYGRIVVNLSNKNKKKVAEYFLKIYKKNINRLRGNTHRIK